jgi:nucleoside-diphosphate-sugar epimerase
MAGRDDVSPTPAVGRESNTATLPRVVVVGAGWIGAIAASRLHALGHEVVATNRRGEHGTNIPSMITMCSVDLVRDDAGAIRAAIGWRDGDVAVLCHASGGTQDRRAVFVEGARRLVASCEGVSLARVVHASSTSALPDVDEVVGEDDPRWPSEERGRIQRETEGIVREGFAARGTPVTTLRFGGLYGPGRELARLYLRAMTPGVPLVIEGDAWTHTNLIHRDDAAEALVLAARLDPPLDTIVHVVDDDPAPRRLVIERVTASLGLPLPHFTEPAPNTLPRGKRVDNARMHARLGLHLVHPRHT